MYGDMVLKFTEGIRGRDTKGENMSVFIDKLFV